ncbi:carboxylesterase family protein [Sarocladium implicatum]|nr:carboxylesterase family protein [Sarocladium implicatum]
MSVSINYRVGFYGFPGGVQATQAGIVNLGLKDQRLALAWIQENIEAFGGDPNKVTLWGQSAGSAAIGYQWLAYDGQGAENLFRGTILVSGGPLSSNMLYPTHPNCIEGYENILNVTGCDAADNTLECVKETSVDDVLLASSTAPFPTWWPSIDGDFIVRPPDWQLQIGHFSPKISSIVGANNDEGLVSANLYAQGVETEEDLQQVLKKLFPAARDSVLQEVLDAYPADGPSPPYSLPTPDDRFCEAMIEAGLPCPGQYRRVAAIVGDYAQIGARRVQARGYSAGGAKVYSYRFDTNPTSIPIVLNGITPGFATHSSEYAYFFGFPPNYNLNNLNPTVPNVTSHLALSRGIVDKLVAYIATGDPNKAKVPGFPRWPLYSNDSPKNMVFNATESDDKLNVHIEADTWRKEGMGLWEKYPVELQFGSNWRP